MKWKRDGNGLHGFTDVKKVEGQADKYTYGWTGRWTDRRMDRCIDLGKNR